MAERRNESGEQRQRRIQREQHRPEQDAGYDEAVRGGRDVADDRPAEQMIPAPPDVAENSGDRIDDEATRAAIEDVRRHEHSADRRVKSTGH
jgi:hypothetical protein